MLIARENIITKTTSTMDLDVTEEQITDWVTSRHSKGGRLIQDIMPNLTPEEREFLISGIKPDEWDELFGETEDFDTEEWMGQGREVGRSSESVGE